MVSMFDSTGYNNMTSLNLGKKFIINNDKILYQMFQLCGKNSTEMRVIVGSQQVKDAIKNLPDEVLNAREFWKTNDSIIVVQP